MVVGGKPAKSAREFEWTERSTGEQVLAIALAIVRAFATADPL